MISKEELEKLTVLQLKEKLKSRKLLISGTKPDLVARLYESILAEEKLLGNLDIENESAGPSEFDLTNVDVDEVLGLDSELISPNSIHKKIELDSTLESLHEATTKLQSPKKIEAEIKKPEIKAPVTVPSPTKKTISYEEEKKSQNGNHKTDSANIVSESLDDANKKAVLSVEDGQKMLQISKRLGLPCKTTNDNAQDAFAKRAERFGPVNPDDSKKQHRLERFGLSNSSTVDDKIAKRIQRFGSLNTDEVSNKKARVGNSSEEIEKLRKRAERFGNGLNKA